MRASTTLRPVRVVLAATVASALLVALAAVGPTRSGTVAVASAATTCPDGFTLVDRAELMIEQTLGSSGEGGARRSAGDMLDPVCMNNKHPESMSEIGAMQSQRASIAAAPNKTPPRGSFRAALQQQSVLAALSPSVRGSDGRWTPLGKTPLMANEEGYDSVNGQGLVKLNGRVDSMDYDPATERVFASIGTGGVWMSENFGKSWESIGDSLPTQTVGAVAWSPAAGGTLIVGSGEPLMGGNTNMGIGAFYSRDLGKTWEQATGIRDGLMTFQVAVDPATPTTVYIATSMGLYRSTDAGETYRNVKLPTGGGCAGNTEYNRCQFANFVTDVVVQEPGGTTKEAGGKVIAAVGYRAGMAQYPNGKVHAPGNGIYGSDTGAPGTFNNLNAADNGFGCQSSPTGGAPTCAAENIGRTELGNAVGAKQNHNYLYAILEDAELFNGGVPSIDVDEPGNDDQVPVGPTSFNGIYVSDDFGQTWTQMADTAEVALNPTTHSSLVGTATATLFAPGVQAWYNMWIKPDPAQQDATGVPTRLTFGLEEVWTNRCPNPQNSANQVNTCDPTAGEVGDFEVVGPYFAETSCLFLDTGVPQCPTAENFTNPDTTTHADQQEALYIPKAGGGSRLVVGNDGGTYVQDVTEGGGRPKAGDWGEGDNDGFHTLLPYDAEASADGTVWYGLQDNGSGKITPKGRQIMAFGGDGVFVAVDPKESDYAWSETPGAAMRVTTDGGKNWRYAAPEITGQFANMFVMDPTDADHLMTAGNDVVETTYGPDTQQYDPVAEAVCVSNCWETVFNLGTTNGADNAMSAVDLQGDAAYVGFCAVCDVLNNWSTGFHSGLATNIGGDAPPERMTSNGWHIAKAEGLPNRYITSIAISPDDPETVYVTLGGYNNREWVPPGSYLDDNKRIGSGHVFKSTDGGETFTDISGSLPDTTTTWVEQHGDQLVVGTDIGAFLSSDLDGSRWAALDGLPNVYVSTIKNFPGHPRKVVVATFGRGVYTYTFPYAADDDGFSDGNGDKPGVDDEGDGGGGGVSPGDGGRGVLPATGGGLAAVGVASMLIGAVVVGLPARRRRRR